MNIGRLVVAVVAPLLLAGCASRIELPAREAGAASATAAGVEVAAATGAWRGWPSDLDRAVTPIRVTVVNRGRVPVRIDATALALGLPDGRRLAAVLADEVRGVAVGPPPAAMPRAGLTLGPTRESSGPGWAINDPQPDPRSEPTQEPDRSWQLPSPDMFALALPEGVLAPGETARGFVYFERAPPGVGTVQLRVPIVDARSGETLEVAAIPMTLR